VGNRGRDAAVEAAVLRASLLLLTACSSLDEVVWVSVPHASVDVSPKEPTGLAHVQVTVQLHGGPRADRDVFIASVKLGETPVPMSFPPEFSGHVSANEDRWLTLANHTSNEMLAPLCGQTAELAVDVGFEDDPDTWSGSPPLSLVVQCL